MTTAQTSAAWVPSPPPANTFANRLRLLRLAMDDAGAQETAARCGVPYPTWRKWEAGALPRDMAQVVRKIHDATGVDMAWLMWGTGPDTSEEQPGHDGPATEDESEWGTSQAGVIPIPMKLRQVAQGTYEQKAA